MILAKSLAGAGAGSKKKESEFQRSCGVMAAIGHLGGADKRKMARGKDCSSSSLCSAPFSTIYFFNFTFFLSCHEF